ncbi:Ger(x)C family spore germination protein [Neobacillus vireti]|uniref:Ger(x)C family spore germination protein n=1 Tax=Neobacillus vireti TaxID=220686 RepID=UPI003000B3BE
MKKTTILLIMCLLILTGCWDQDQLKETRLAVGVGYDDYDNGELFQTTDIRVPKLDSSGTGRPAVTSVIMHSTGATPRQARMNLEKEVAGNYAPNKVLVYILGEELAKKDIYPILDVLYRYPRNSLSAKIVVANGRAEDILSLKVVEEKLVSDALLKIIESAEDDTFIPRISIQSVCPIIFNEGQDFGLPKVGRSDNDALKITGLALFNGKKYTGIDLGEDEASILLILNNEEIKMARFNLKVNPEEKRKILQYVTVHVFTKRHDLKIKLSNNQQISAEVKIKLKVHVAAYPKDNLSSKKELQTLTKKITEEFTRKAEHVISETQRANCDYLGIGKHVQAYYPKTWAKLDWNQTYPTIKITPKIQTQIIETGIIK